MLCGSEESGHLVGQGGSVRRQIPQRRDVYQRCLPVGSGEGDIYPAGTFLNHGVSGGVSGKDRRCFKCGLFFEYHLLEEFYRAIKPY